MNQPISVLVVDDETIILECLSIYFEDEGFEVHTATSAETALQLMKSVRPHICITDMGLDGMNGEEFILKAHAVNPGTRFLIHTGAAYTLTDELCAVGMTLDDIMIKPIYDFTVFLGRIRALAAGGEENNVA
jgi:DNA-binding response OmpR family regulator